MELNSEKVEIMVDYVYDKVFPKEVIKFDDEKNLKFSLENQIVPIFIQLPENVTKATLDNYRPIFMDQALTFAFYKLRKTLIFKDAPDSVLLENISQNYVMTVARYLYTISSLALEGLDEVKTTPIKDLIENFADLDLNFELKKLLEEESQ